jgi:hypothetical protein
MRIANHDKKTNIPESYVTRLDNMEKELMGLDNSICSGISDLQSLRFGFVPRDTPKKSLTSGKQQRGRGREIKEIVEQHIWGWE